VADRNRNSEAPLKLSRGITLFLLAMLAFESVRSSAAERPNFVLIMSDDMGFSEGKEAQKAKIRQKTPVPFSRLVC
jgi:hypothetical protein